MLAGERNREFVLSREDEPTYLAACPEPLQDLALLILDTGLRAGEATRLAWEDLDFEARTISIRKGKTKNAVRVLPLTDRALEMLKRRSEFCVDEFVFEQFCQTYWCRLHSRVRAKLGFDRDFVIHSLRHTALTRLSAHTEVFTLCKIAGHAHVGTTQRYVHPAAESMRAAMDRLNAEALVPRLAPAPEKAKLKTAASG